MRHTSAVLGLAFALTFAQALSLPRSALALPAAADNTADEADLAFSRGNDAFSKGRYDEALGHYFLSHRLVPNRNVLFNIARCFEAMNRHDEAYRYYADLSRQELGPDDAREVARSLQRIRPRVALVQVESEPAGAEVYVDRVDLGLRGRTPLTLALSPGPHTIMVRKDGHRSSEREATLQRGRELTERFELPLVTGTVRLTGSPQGAWVREAADGPVIGTLPAELALVPGQRTLFVGAEGFGTQQLLVEVKGDERTAREVALGPAPLATGRLVVTANRESALVLLDGKEVGFTPAVLTVPVGEHRLSISRPDLSPFETKVLITEGAEERVNADLYYRPPPVRAASKSLADVDEAPASVTVITREEIDGFGYQTLAEALSGVRGLYLTNDRIYTYLGIRGFAPPGDLNTRLLILWDGHAMNDVWAGQAFAGHDLAVDLDEVARIEVVRGPGSTLYGTGAFFAVVNLVPRDALSGRRNVEVTGGTGALGRWRGHAAAGWSPDETTSVVVSGAALGVKGAEVTNLGSLGTVQGNDAERARFGSARVRWGEFTFFGLVNDREKLIPTAPYGTLIGTHGSMVDDSRGFAELRWDRTLANGGSFSARGYYDATRYEGRWPFPGATPDEPLLYRESGRADWVGGEARGRLRLFGQNHLTAGLELQHQYRIEQEFFAETVQPLERRQRTLFSAYLLDEWRLHPRALLSAGLRVDRYLDLDVTPVTPRLALILKPYAAGVTKLVAGQAFRAPNAYELYYHDLNLSQRVALSLRPEIITTFEIEHAHDLTRELRLTVSGYHNRISDLVVLETDAGEPQCGSPRGTEACIAYTNVDDLVRAFGAEAGLRWQPGRHLMVDASYSFVNLVGAAAELTAGTPRHLASGRILVPLLDSNLRLSAQGGYQSARSSPRIEGGAGEALLLDVGLSGESEHLRWFAGVRNLLDEEYALPVGNEFSQPLVPQYGRTFTLQMTARY